MHFLYNLLVRNDLYSYDKTPLHILAKLKNTCKITVVIFHRDGLKPLQNITNTPFSNQNI